MLCHNNRQAMHRYSNHLLIRTVLIDHVRSVVRVESADTQLCLWHSFLWRGLWPGFVLYESYSHAGISKPAILGPSWLLHPPKRSNVLFLTCHVFCTFHFREKSSHNRIPITTVHPRLVMLIPIPPILCSSRSSSTSSSFTIINNLLLQHNTINTRFQQRIHSRCLALEEAQAV